MRPSPAGTSTNCSSFFRSIDPASSVPVTTVPWPLIVNARSSGRIGSPALSRRATFAAVARTVARS
ncbi:MAG TPA: hypothetical protein VFG69_00340, partial [Nannocystaceae bacterium]|nr:hypothetical protein [Nannocystaceae bacterium]